MPHVDTVADDPLSPSEVISVEIIIAVARELAGKAPSDEMMSREEALRFARDEFIRIAWPRVAERCAKAEAADEAELRAEQERAAARRGQA